MTRHIMYEGVPLDEPTELYCSECGDQINVRWWWTPDDNHFVVCPDCIDDFEVRDEWPDAEHYGKFEQQSLWKEQS